jgi:hypothetical protein
MAVTASYEDGSQAAVTGYTLSSPDMSAAGTKTVTASYTRGGITKTASFQITVTALTNGATVTLYWINEQDKLAFSNGATASISRTGSLTINAQGEGYTGQRWFINGVEDSDKAGQSSYTFSGWNTGRNEVVHIYNKLASEFGNEREPVEFSAEDFNATPLTGGVWADGNITGANQENWHSFTAIAATQYIHVDFGTLSANNGVYVQLYDSAGATAGSQGILNGSNPSISVTQTSGQYYVRVTPYNTSFTGAYEMVLNASVIPPRHNADNPYRRCLDRRRSFQQQRGELV